MPDPPPPGRRFPHPLDLLALLGAALVATAAFSWLFRRTEVPRPVDPLLGTVLEVRFEADLPWKEGFGRPGSTVRVDGILRARVEGVETATDALRRTRRLRIRVLDREGQDPYALTEFRWGIWRGSTVSLRDEPAAGVVVSTVNAEVLAVEPP